jgi:hypothetical protein
MSVVACFTKGTAVPAVTITSTFILTNSAAISAKRSLRPSAHRYSMVTVRPSIQPSSRSRSTKPASQRLHNGAVVAPKSPIVGSFTPCCAFPASGHMVAAPPRTIINSRRRMNCPSEKADNLTHHWTAGGRCASQRNIPAYVGSGSFSTELVWTKRSLRSAMPPIATEFTVVTTNRREVPIADSCTAAKVSR